MPKGKGGFTKISMYMDMYSQHLWADKLKTAALGNTTCKSLNNICTTFTNPEALMVDGGSKFDNHAVHDTCAACNIKL